jgi:uncharacterized protein (DUF2249 family)
VTIELDCREMLPPEPLERVMAALDEIRDGDELVLLINMQPVPLFNILRRYGYIWEECDGPGGSLKYRITRSLKSLTV